MARKILLLNFDSKRRSLFEKDLSQLGGDYDIQQLDDIEELRKVQGKIHSVFYLHTKGIQEFEGVVGQIGSIKRNVPVNVIFRKRDFKVLMKALDFSLATVLDKDYSLGDLRKALARSDQRNFQVDDHDLPVKGLMDLLSSPIKTKSDRDLYRKLYSYFKSFPFPIEFSILGRSNNELELVAGPKPQNEALERKIKETRLPTIFIGESVEEKVSDEKTLVAFPVFEGKGKGNETWCVCGVEERHKDLVFNNFFFRYLENVLVYRKSFEKSSDYLDLSNKDDVTGLFNQRKLVADMAKAVDYHASSGKNFSIMFIDVDHFKKVNDNFGHLVGSKMLIEIAQELRKLLRSSDDIYRYGGDEFVVVMPEVNVKTVHKIAMRVIESMKEKTFNIDGAKNYHLSLSIGIAEFPTDAQTAEEIIRYADSMMYVSKKSGRGKVFHIGEVREDAAL